MNLDLLQSLDFKKNRFLRAAPQLLTAEPGDPVLGEILCYDPGTGVPAAQRGRVAIYDAKNGEGWPWNLWRFLSGSNRNDEVTGLWTWNSPIRGGGLETGAPFLLGSSAQFATGAIYQNRVVGFNSDYLDGRGAEEWADAVPSGLVIPVSNSTGQLRVNDPVKDFDAVNRRTLLATTTGLVVVAPCKAATTARLAGARSGNVITASANGVYAPDGVTLALNDRVLLKDQENGGTGIDNGIYTVTTLGTASVPVVLTRAGDADTTGELTVGTLCFISSGTVNAATQWSCQRPPGTGGGSIIVINSDVQLWQKTFGQTAYIEGRGIKFNGLEINFAQSTNYTTGNLFTATGATTMGPLANPSAKRFLSHPGTTNAQPEWSPIAVADISNWPDVVTAPGLGVSPRITRFSGTTQITDSKLEDVTGAIRAYGNTVAIPTTGLGDNTHPFGILWTSALRLKPTAGITTPPNPVLSLLGIQSDANDSNTDHKAVVTWTSSTVKAWLAITASDIGAASRTTTLTIAGASGITVAPTGAQDLSQDRSWLISFDSTVYDNHWVTTDAIPLGSVQNINGSKRFWNSSPSTAVIEVATASAGNPNLLITAGASVRWGDGSTAPTATIDYDGANGRLRVSGKPVEFAASSVVKLTSAIASSGSPISLLGLTVTDDVRRVSLTDLGTFVGQPALANHAVGYGDGSGKLTGNASTLYFDYSAGQEKLGIRCTPASTLDVLGTFNLANTVTSGPFPGGLIGVIDNSANTADWTGRSMYGLYVSATKNGAATFGGSANLYAITGTSVVSNGSVTGLVGVRASINIGAAAGGGPTVNNVWAFYSTSSTPAGPNATIGAYTHFHADSLSTMAQPGEHYGFRCVNLASGTGATRTAGLRLDLVSTGLGQRYNIYAPGDAVSFFAGPIGLGVALTPAVTSPPSAITPTARLEFAVGTATLAPIRFAATSALSSLLSPPLAGHLESTGDRLNFTDTLPSRHALAFYDDLGFTNDSSSTPAGGVIFDQSAHMLATLDLANSIGQGDFTLWARFRMPAAFRGPNVEGVCGVSSSSSTGLTYNNAAKIAIGGAGQVYFYISTDSSNYRVLKTVGLFFSVYGGKVVDVVVVRKGTAAPTLYLNGTAQAVTDTPGGSPPTWDMAVNSSYLHAGKDDTGGGSVPEIFRVAFFNYAMSAADALDVSRQGRVASADKYGSMTGMTVTNAGFEGGFAAGVPNGWTKGASVTTADEAAIFHGGLHSVRFTAGGLPGNTSSNWLYLSALTPLKRHLVQAWAQRVSGTGNLSIGAGYQAVALGAMGGTIASAGTWTRFGGVCRAEGGQTGGLYNTYLTLAGWTALDVWLIDDVTVQQVGAIADMDFSVGCGSVIPDRSGRYPGTLTPAQPTAAWEHAISTCPLEVTSGSGTIARGLRRFTQTVSAKDGDTVTVTHSLGTQNITVMVWNAAGASVAVAVNLKAGTTNGVANALNQVEIGFALIGAPTPPGTTVLFTVVIIG